MSDNSKKIEIDIENKRAQIIYTTDKGKVKVSFRHRKQSKSDPDVSSESIRLVADVESKSKSDSFYDEIASASEEVYYSWSDMRGNDSSSSGNDDFLYNMENVTLKHDNPGIEKLIKQAQMDIAERIPEEKQRLQHLEEQAKQVESDMRTQEALKKREKENAFTKKYLDSIIGRND